MSFMFPGATHFFDCICGAVFTVRLFGDAVLDAATKQAGELWKRGELHACGSGIHHILEISCKLDYPIPAPTNSKEPSK